MARKQRKKSDSGIYHVMLRGINKQDVFLDNNDFESMLKALREAQVTRGGDGRIVSESNCTYYAYCILHNHMHLLVREGDLSISEIMKKIQDRFVFIYNKKYDRVGHLFQDRFVSEPVDDTTYFQTLIRYIHRNPVKAMEAAKPEDYKYSSWREYLWFIKGSDPLMIQLCDVSYATEIIGKEQIEDFVNQDVDDACMDMDSFTSPMREVDAWEILAEISNSESVEYFKQLAPEYQLKCLAQLVAEGASLRQASRLSSLSYRTIWNYLHPEEFAAQQEERRRKRREKRKNSGSSRGQTP